MNETEKDKDLAIKDETALVLLKAQKLTSALYLVSSFLPDQEPLKWRLREQALEALSETKSAITAAGREGICLFDHAISSIGQLNDLIGVALALPGVSQMNFSILQGEYQNLERQMSQMPSPFLSLTLAPSAARSALPVSSPRPLVAKPVLKKTSEASPNSRQELILNYLKNNGWSSIKDIAQRLPQVSSKTVQRELALLVAQGAIKREGDRRWSRYALVDSSA